MRDDASWMDSALCREVDPNLFHPEPGEGARTQVNQAIQICRACPVVVQCRDYGRRFSRGYGIWGGVYRSARTPDRGPAEIMHGTEAGHMAHRRRGEKPCGECMRAATLAKALRTERRRTA
jgi:WhiB family redox-sensing transcriptional regulator